MKRAVIWLPFLWCLTCAHVLAVNPPAITNKAAFLRYFKLIPQPQNVAILSGKGLTATALQAVSPQGAAKKPVLREPLASLPLKATAGANTLILKLSDAKNIPPSSEGYVLEIKNGGVVIQSRDQAGLFYGCQTLTQLLDDARDQQISIPACTITDYPDIAYRAVHLDLKHHLDDGNYYYELMDRLAQVKVNAVIVEFEDKLRYQKAPLVGASNAISIDEFAAISRYAKERNIEISPLVQGLGHASFILKHDAYKKLRENPASDWAFSPLDPKTYELQFALYEDAMAATPNGKYLHVGGDEVGDLGMSELSKKSGLKPLELQMYWLTKVCEFARQHNRTPIFWDDMVFKLAGLYQTTYDASVPTADVTKIWQENEHRLNETINLFPKDCIYMRWNYDTPDIPGNHKAIDWYKSHKLNIMAATSAQQIWPLLPRAQSNFKSIQNFCKITADQKLTGILCTIWDDCSPHFETVWRGIYDFAGLSWHYTNVPVTEAHTAFRHRFYAPAVSDTTFEFEDLLEKALPFWETALLAKGDRDNAHPTFELIGLPNPAKSDTWNVVYSAKLKQAHTEITRYTTIKNRIANVSGLARRNTYSLALMNSINELQIYPANLLLLLEACDKLSPTSPEGQAAKQQVKDYVQRFTSIRSDFESVFSKTRFLTNPPDYQLDDNVHHHLANATNSSDWMYTYELAMNKKVMDWLAK